MRGPLSRTREGWGEGGCVPAKILFLMRSSKRLNRKSQLTTAEYAEVRREHQYFELTLRNSAYSAPLRWVGWLLN